MNQIWLRRIAGFVVVAGLAPTAASAQDREAGTALPQLSAGIAVQAARLASSEARQSVKFESTSQRSSSQGQAGRRAACAASLGFIGLLVGAAIAEKFPGPRGDGPTNTQLVGIAIGGGTGLAIGSWLGGR